MPAVFVHGVPDTFRVWRPLVRALTRKDTICLALPGFDAPRPPGFKADKDSYAAWLVDELKKIDGPIDLVGHDWGSLLVTRAVSVAPDLVRSWCAGGAPLDPDYVWHETAQTWQTPGKGEELMQMVTPQVMTPALAAQGIPMDAARETAEHIDDEMKQCILALYRSATRVSDDWFAGLKNIKAPALILWGARDPYASPQFGERLAQNVSGAFQSVDSGHWYEVEQPDFVARRLEAFWAELS
ncbi:MAG: alpha/beta hydrolase [Terricaulis sp.]